MDLGIRNQHDTSPTRPGLRPHVLWADRYSLESRTEGFVFPHEGYSDETIPFLIGTKENTALNIWFVLFCPAAFSSNNWNLTWKFTGGGGFFGSILTTLDSTFGGGRKLFFPTWSKVWRRGASTLRHSSMKKNPLKSRWCCVYTANTTCCTLTFMRWSTRASSCVLIDSLQYSLSPGAATSRMANSLWNINTAHLKKTKKTKMLNAKHGHTPTWTVKGSRPLAPSYLKKGRCSRSLKTNGDEICTMKKIHV